MRVHNVVLLSCMDFEHFYGFASTGYKSDLMENIHEHEILHLGKNIPNKIS